MEEKESKAIPEKKVSSKLAAMRKKMQEMNKWQVNVRAISK